MNNRLPKRKKDKYNPYTILFNEKDNSYYLKFCDINKNIQIIRMSFEIYDAFNKFELEDISQMHKIDKHIERSEVFDQSLYRRALNKDTSVEQIIEKKNDNRELYVSIGKLNSMQKRRIIKYFFEDKTLREIAKEEGCSYVSVKNSIDRALNNLKKFLN